MVTTGLATFALGTQGTDIPEVVFDRACVALIDTIGVSLAGTREPPAQLAVSWLRDLAARPQASLWGSELRTSVAEAAFANAVACHALDFDDSHPGLRGHPSTTLLPTAMAVGETTGASGEEVLAAYAIGMEIAAKLGRSMGQGHILRGWHMTSTVGVLAAACVACRLWGLDENRLRYALGLAGSQAAGLVRNFGTTAKALHAGNAARNGVVAAWMAKNGATADASILDGKGSLLETYGGHDGQPAESWLAALAAPWEIDNPGVYVKRWPCCYSAHRALGGVFELRQTHRLAASEIEEIAIGFPPGSDASLIKTFPADGLEAKFSVEYVVAAGLLDGDVVVETFTDAMVRRPAVQDLMRKVRRYSIADERLYSGVTGYTDVHITARGKKLEVRVDRVPGSPQWPLTQAELMHKFMTCAGSVLGTARATQLHSKCLLARSLPDVRELIRETAPRAASN